MRLLTYGWSKNPSDVVMTIGLVVLLLAGGFMTFWTIAGLVWALAAVALVVMTRVAR